MARPYLIVLAGPNGSGKTTYARTNLQSFIETGIFLNADDIAREGSPSDVQAAAIEAGRIAIQRRSDLLRQGKSLCVETTLAGNSIIRFMREAKDIGYVVRLIFLFTASPELNEARVMQRVMEGGHNIPVDVIRRRHRRGLERLADCWAICDEGLIVDARTRRPSPMLTKEDGKTKADDGTAADLFAALTAGGHKAPT